MNSIKRMWQQPGLHRIRHAIRHHKLTFALGLAITGTLALTVVSVSMYYVGGFYRYDLSRPGYEKERTEIARPAAQKDYDTTSPVSKTTIDIFLQEFDLRQKDLQAYGDYRDPSLTEEDLQLTQAE